jgi:hypothetical protein
MLGTFERVLSRHCARPRLSAGDDVRPGGIAHASVAGARETLPATSPYPQFLIGYSTLRISCAVTGGTIIPDSVVKTSDATINGFVVASSTAILGSTIVTTVNGPIPPGDFVAAGFTVAVHEADFSQASGTLRFQDGRSTMWIKVKVKADKISEPNEVFYVELYDAKGGAMIVRGRATGTILNG